MFMYVKVILKQLSDSRKAISLKNKKKECMSSMRRGKQKIYTILVKEKLRICTKNMNLATELLLLKKSKAKFVSYFVIS